MHSVAERLPKEMRRTGRTDRLVATLLCKFRTKDGKRKSFPVYFDINLSLLLR